MVCALVSLLTGLCVPVDTAMTGEVVTTPSTTIFFKHPHLFPDHPPRPGRARRRDQRKSLGSAQGGFEEGDTPLGEPERRRSRCPARDQGRHAVFLRQDEFGGVGGGVWEGERPLASAQSRFFARE